ncbi:MAG: SpoIIE family protein phosphatase [Vicinamibacteraceae bacterium]|nr:SpoIIE family protein phosphatase [Vicinamibacteraceae bacterium]
MSRATTPRRRALQALALLLAAVATWHAATWAYYIRKSPPAFLGIEYDYTLSARAVTVTSVAAGSPADTAGLRVGDEIAAVNGRPLDTLNPLYDALLRGTPGDAVSFTVSRAGAATRSSVRAALGPPPAKSPSPVGQRIALDALSLFPLPFLLVGFTVLALRLDDRHAWLLALAFVGIGTGGPMDPMRFMPPPMRGPAYAHAILCALVTPALVYTFLATFPAVSLLDRRAPWLKKALLGVSIAAAVPLAASALTTGSLLPAGRFLAELGIAGWVDSIVILYAYGSIALGFVSLALNCLHPPSVEARRKARLIAWSFVLGLSPWLLVQGAGLVVGHGAMAFPFWLWAVPALMLMLLPLVFGYVVVKHRVLELSVLVKRSARYIFVQRGFVLLTLALSIAVMALVATFSARLLPRLTNAAVPSGVVVGALFALVMIRTGSRLSRRVEQRIDRAFFREAYDARRVLGDLAGQVGAAMCRDDLASLIEAALNEALHPRGVALYAGDDDRGALTLVRGPAGVPEALDRDLPLFTPLTGARRFMDMSAARAADAALAAPFGALEPECLVPLLNRRSEIIGILALGPRLSDEPYSRDDRMLLTAVARQAGLALESLGLAEQIAERRERDRRAARDMEIASDVQRRFLPQRAVPMSRVAFAGRCQQARAVGGDYFDFLELGPGCLGLALADISGKGLYAALLMAHLQASLRALSAAGSDLVPTLRALNRSFCESTAGNHYATLFFGRIDDDSGRLRYVNCGHLPPLVLRGAGGVERLRVTAGAIGMYEPWSCETEEITIAQGDLLVLFSDGLTEALDARGRELGEAGLLALVEAHRQQPLPVLIDRVIDAVIDFAGGDQQDDLTLVAVRGEPVGERRDEARAPALTGEAVLSHGQAGGTT